MVTHKLEVVKDAKPGDVIEIALPDGKTAVITIPIPLRPDLYLTGAIFMDGPVFLTVQSTRPTLDGPTMITLERSDAKKIADWLNGVPNA